MEAAGVRYEGIAEALRVPGTELRLFGADLVPAPPHGVALAEGRTRTKRAGAKQAAAKSGRWRRSSLGCAAAGRKTLKFFSEARYCRVGRHRQPHESAPLFCIGNLAGAVMRNQGRPLYSHDLSSPRRHPHRQTRQGAGARRCGCLAEMETRRISCMLRWTVKTGRSASSRSMTPCA